MTFQPFQAICKSLKSLVRKNVPSFFQPFQPYCKSLKTLLPTSFQPCASNPPTPPYRWEGHLGGAHPPVGKGLRNLFVVTADTSLAALFLHRGRERGDRGLERRGKVSERRQRRNGNGDGSGRRPTLRALSPVVCGHSADIRRHIYKVCFYFNGMLGLYG